MSTDTLSIKAPRRGCGKAVISFASRRPTTYHTLLQDKSFLPAPVSRRDTAPFKLCDCAELCRKYPDDLLLTWGSNIYAIWWRVPKSASSSIVGTQQELVYPDPPAPEKPIEFAIVRNPWDRVVSLWKHFTAQSYGGRFGWFFIWYKKKFNREIKLGEVSFEHFVMDCILEMDQSVECCHLYPQRWWIPKDRDVELWKLENLDDTFKERLATVGVITRLPRFNVSKTSFDDYQQYYTPAIKARVDEIYSEDLEMLKGMYTFDHE